MQSNKIEGRRLKVERKPLDKEIVSVAATSAPLETENKVMWTAAIWEKHWDGPVGSAAVSVSMSSSELQAAAQRVLPGKSRSRKRATTRP